MPATRRTPRPRRALLASLACMVAVATAGCSGDTEKEAPPPPPPATALADLELDDLTVARRDPCAGIDPEVLVEVVGTDHDDVRGWQPGQALPGSKQLGDEFGCEVVGPDATARAWVFAPPVGRPQARSLVRDATALKCRRLPGASFGTPGVTFSCDLNSGDALHGMRGLVGDAWLACEVQVDDATRSDPSRAERWCVAVLGSLSG